MEEGKKGEKDQLYKFAMELKRGRQDWDLGYQNGVVQLQAQVELRRNEEKGGGALGGERRGVVLNTALSQLFGKNIETLTS